MKKWMALTALVMVLLCAMLPALADGTIGSDLSFTQRDFYGGQTLKVYYGPGTEYGRGANGWAKCSTDDALYAAGKENGWALVMYYTSGGSVRVGYVNMDQFKYNTKILKLKEIRFEYSSATITSDCRLTDDPVLDNRDLCYLNSGAKVTYLGSFYKYRPWAYIETWADGHPIRGFVPADCISY